MSISFERALRMYQADEINGLAGSPEGLRFLLLKALDRPEYEGRLARLAGLNADEVKGRARLRTLFASSISSKQARECIAEIYQAERRLRRDAENTLVAELYKMKAFDWGGLHQNSLETTIVDNYVKRITRFDALNQSIENELLVSMRGYVQCSWYNHWTSILIEDIFKDQPGVTPAVGKIKKIDFFVDDIPFDLKVTYLPEGFIKDERRARGLRPEITLLKQSARRNRLAIDDTMPESQLLEQLWLMLSDLQSDEAQRLVKELGAFRKEVVKGISSEPERLIRWLYENQGVRRFDASNRLFLILINEPNYFESWKLKRTHSLLESKIKKYIAERGSRGIGRTISFVWEGKSYSVTSDVLVVTHAA